MPYGQNKYPRDFGEPLLLEPANPGAGAGYSLVVPANCVYVIDSIRFTFVTSVTVANRQFEVGLYNAAAVLFLRQRSATVQAASLTRDWNCWTQGSPITPISAINEMSMPIDNSVVPAGCSVQLNFLNIQAADQLSAIKIYVRKFRIT